MLENICERYSRGDKKLAKKFMQNKDNLSAHDLLKLKAAIKCHEICSDFEKKFYATKQ